jgi:hypothetical protein
MQLYDYMFHVQLLSADKWLVLKKPISSIIYGYVISPYM